MKASLFKTEKGLKIVCVSKDVYPSQTFTFNAVDLVFTSQLRRDILFVQDFIIKKEDDKFLSVIKSDVVLVETKKDKENDNVIVSEPKLKNVDGCLIAYFYVSSFATIRECFGLFNFINQYKAIKSSLNL